MRSVEIKYPELNSKGTVDFHIKINGLEEGDVFKLGPWEYIFLAYLPEHDTRYPVKALSLNEDLKYVSFQAGSDFQITGKKLTSITIGDKI